MIACCKKTRATIVDGSLVVSLPHAEKPCVWKMDMARIHSAALELREENNNFILGIKGAKGDVTDIAGFADKKRAETALASITRAMLKGGAKKSRRWLKIILVLFAVFVLFLLIFGGGGQSGTSRVSSPGKLEQGKLLQAEDVFKN